MLAYHPYCQSLEEAHNALPTVEPHLELHGLSHKLPDYVLQFYAQQVLHELSDTLDPWHSAQKCRMQGCTLADTRQHALRCPTASAILLVRRPHLAPSRL